MSDRDIQQTIDFWDAWLNKNKNAHVGEFMLFGGRSLEVLKDYAALKSRLEEAERIVKVVSDGGCLVCLEGGVGCNVHEGNDCIRRLVKQWRRGAQVDGGGE